MALIAGHNFNAGPLGNLCSNVHMVDGVEVRCGKNLVDILGATEGDINKSGFACVGILSSGEYDQIKTERDRIWNTLKH